MTHSMVLATDLRVWLPVKHTSHTHALS